jgi:NADPH-dependent glutamate synthase beta subunit-like oxidoreductase
MDELRNDIKERCREGEPAFCGAVCPFRLDVPSFIRKIRRGAWSAAYRAYRDAVVFPDTVSRLCSAPCREACCSVCGGAPIDLPMLEHAVVAAAPDRRPNRYNVPPSRSVSP